MDDAGVQLLGNYTLNGQSVATQTEVDSLHARINNLDSDLQDVNDLIQELLQFRS
jgi:polyhydroxyalkanoate synthesis regulator phasin